MPKPFISIKEKPILNVAILVFCWLILNGTHLFGANTHVVTNANDHGEGSFRYFVNLAENEDSIRFAEPFVIPLDSEVVINKKSIWIDGKVGDQKVQLNGQGKTRALTLLGAEDLFMYIRNLEITNCYADYGGGMKTYCMYDYCEVIIENIDFNRNLAKIRGGAGVFAGVLVRGCMFFANNSERDGGATYAAKTQFMNCVFLGNLCFERASAGFFNHDVEVLNCTFIMNEPDLFYNVEPAKFYNSLFWNEFRLMRSQQVAEFESCATNGWSEPNMITMEDSPFVATPDAGEDTIWGTWDDEIDIRMKYQNPCIDKGGFHEEMYAVSTDFFGGFRIVNDTIDIGAIEYDPAITDSDDDGVMDSEDAYPQDPTQY